MTNNTTTTSAPIANFDGFMSDEAAKQGLMLHRFNQLITAAEKDALLSIRRQIKLGQIISAGRDFIKSPHGALILKTYGIAGKIDEILTSIYGYKKAFLYRLMQAAENEAQISDFEAYVFEAKKQGPLPFVVNLETFNYYAKNGCLERVKTDKPKSSTVQKGAKIEIAGAKFTEKENGDVVSTLTIEQINALLRKLVNERKRLLIIEANKAQAERQNLEKAAKIAATNERKKAGKKAGKGKTVTA